MRFAIVSQLALAASLTLLACSGAKNYQVNAIFPVEGNEGLEPKVDALLKERGYAVYDKDAGHRRMAELGFVENEYAPGICTYTPGRFKGTILLSHTGSSESPRRSKHTPMPSSRVSVSSTSWPSAQRTLTALR